MRVLIYGTCGMGRMFPLCVCMSAVHVLISIISICVCACGCVYIWVHVCSSLIASHLSILGQGLIHLARLSGQWASGISLSLFHDPSPGLFFHDYICRIQLLILLSSFTIFHIILRQNLLLNLETAWPLTARDCLFHGSIAKPSFCVGSGDVNPGPHAYTVSTLPTEAAPSPRSLLASSLSLVYFEFWRK